MGQDIIDQCREVNDVILFTASSCRQSQLRTFKNFYYKKIKVITLTCPRQKDLNAYLTPDSFSNSI